MEAENQNNQEEQKDLAEQMEQEFGNLEIIPSVPLTDQQITSLREAAMKFKELYENFSKISFTEDDSQYYYLLSTQFLKRWKKYVSYEEAISGQQLSQFAGGPQINLKINIDLLDSENKNLFQEVKTKDLTKDYSYLSQFLKPEIYENKDFIFVNDEIWKFFVDQYDAVEFKRYVYGEGKEKKVEIYLKKFEIVILHQDEIKDIDFKYTKELQYIGPIQFSKYLTVEELTEYLEKQINGFALSSNTPYQSNRIQLHDSEFVRIWNLEDTSAENLFKYVLKSANSHKTTSYRIWLDANLINKEGSDKQTIEEQEILDTNLLLIDVKALHKQFSFYNNQIPHEDKCEWCQVFTVLKYPCACKKVAYCSPACKQKDLSYHEDKCDAISDEGVGPFRSENSQLGIVGLQNIGNTCFMNSGLQCLQNCYELSNYFLEHRYLKDMNVDAPLGTKGELTTQYASLIKKLWNGENNVINPRTFKKKLSQYHSIFQGYAQHDSQEFLTELISSMNEDLNLVKKKPIIESQDTDGPLQYWDNYKARNNSIFTYLMSGQFKSQLQCPDCQKISITYDPYFMISLPIPTSAKRKEIEAIYIDSDDQQTQRSFKYSYDKAAGLKLKTFIDFIAEKVNRNQENMISFLASEYYFDDMVYESQELNDVKKKTKYKNLLIRSLNEEELNIPDEQKMETNIANKKFKGLNSYKTAVTPIKKYFWNKNTTLKDVHLTIFKRVKHFLKQTLQDDAEQTDEKIYETVFQGNKPPYQVLIDNKSGYWSECHWCGNKSCSACDLAYTSDITLGDLQEKVKDQTQNGIDFEIQWNFLDDKYKDIEDHYLAYGKEIEEQEKVDKEVNKWNNNKMETEKSTNDVETQEEQKNDNSTQLMDFSKPTNGQEEEEGLSLESCIKHFETPEKLDEFNEVYCRKCEQHKQMEKKMSIQSVPQILIFQFKRFYRKNPQSSFLKKNGTNIKFPLEGLDMTDYIIDKQLPENLVNNEGERVLYDCFGVSNHSGSMLGGHYTAYAKNISTNKWYSYNDSSVHEMHNLDDIVSGMAYIVFYRRRNSNISQEDLQRIIYSKLYNGKVPEINIEEYMEQENNNNNGNASNTTTNGVGNGVSNGAAATTVNGAADDGLDTEDQPAQNYQYGPLNQTGN